MFQPTSFEQAQHAVVGDCNNLSMQVRWDNETPVMIDIISNEIKKRKAKTVLDYGCGTGRIAKGVIERNRDVKIIGLDKSGEMLKSAKDYVLSERFEPRLIDNTKSIKVDFSYAVYVLQHIHSIDLRETLSFLSNSCNSLFVVNSVCRMAVTLDGKGFHEDGVNILSELSRFYSKISWGIPLQYIVDNPVMRKMFLEGSTLHWGALCEEPK